MIKFISVSSGSCGNCYYLEAGNVKILIDVGVPINYLENFFRLYQINPAELNAVLISHEHSDHTASIASVSSRYALPIYVNLETIDSLPKIFSKVNLKALPTNAYFCFGDLGIQTFTVPHDCACAVGFCFYYRKYKLSLVTDLGSVSSAVIEATKGSDLLILEANHDLKMLKQGPYPKFLKQRIHSHVGHLANQDTARLIVKLATGWQQQVMLAHLSATNNNANLAKETIYKALAEAEIDSIKLSVAPRMKPSSIIALKS